MTDEPTEAGQRGHRQPQPFLDARFSSQGATPTPWGDVVEVLQRSEIFWLATVRRDGRPHVTPLPAIWLDDALHFCTGPDEQKAHNLANNEMCVLTTGGNEFLSGLDVVVEGRAVRVTEEALLHRLADMWESKLDWSFDVVDGTFRERRHEVGGEEFDGQGTAYVFAVLPAKILAFGRSGQFSQTRFRL